MLGCSIEILVGRQQDQVVPATKLDEQGVDGPDLNAAPATRISDCGCFDVVIAVGLKEGEGAQTLNKLGASFRPCKALLLQCNTAADLPDRRRAAPTGVP